MSALSRARPGLYLAQGWKTWGLQAVTQQVADFSDLAGDYCFTGGCKWWHQAARGGILYGEVHKLNAACVCVKQPNSNLNGLYSGHRSLQHSASFIFFGELVFPLHSPCWCLLLSRSKELHSRKSLCFMYMLHPNRKNIFLQTLWALFPQGGGWCCFCASERYSLTDWPNNPSWTGEAIILIPLILHRFLGILISANELCISTCSEQHVRSGSAYFSLGILQVSPHFSRSLCMWDFGSRHLLKKCFELVCRQRWLRLTVTTGNSLEEIIVLDQSLKHRKPQCHRKGEELTFHFLSSPVCSD